MVQIYWFLMDHPKEWYSFQWRMPLNRIAT